MIEKHTPYLDLPTCLRCSHAKITCIPNKNFSGEFGYQYPVTCTNELVTSFIGAYGEPSRSFWYDPNVTGKWQMWADGGSPVNDTVKCGHFDPAYYSDESLKIMLSRNEISKEVYLQLMDSENDN